MNKPITFWIPGVPKGQPRPKAFSRGKHAGVYDPGTANEWKAAIHIHSHQYKPALPLTGALIVNLTFYFPRPKGHYHTGKREGELRATAPYLYTAKPDADNAAKAVFDQLTVSRMWLDDAQITDTTIKKRYDADGRGPGCLIVISQAQEV